MRTLTQLHEAYELIMSAELPAHVKDHRLSGLMTELEHDYRVPLLQNPKWEVNNKDVISLYRIISESRNTV